MHRIVITILLFLLCMIQQQAQLIPLSDHFVHHSLAINPAYSGSLGALDAVVLYRVTNTGFEGSPKTMAFSAHSSLNREQVGIGFCLLNDRIGISNQTSMVGNYAYRMNMGNGKIAFGFGIGMTVCRTTWNKLAATDTDDQLLNDELTKGIVPDFSMGVYYNTNKYYIGISLPFFLTHEYQTESDRYVTLNDFKDYNYHLMAGYKFGLAQKLIFYPSVLIKYQNENTIQTDIYTQLIYNDRLWMGMVYRTKNTLAAILQCQVNRQLRVAYSYDFGIGNNNFSFNSNEIMLNYIFEYKADIIGPIQF
ncbi:MAG: type IX secretion system membrane protein PorP/SprF [Bacteroidales bacterium]|nr:type IX secretion system membrane protein PorP/SprF [Bacteroidales bacterium]